MKDGRHFQIPEGKGDLINLWNSAESLTPEMVPDWIKENGEDPKDYRYLGNSSWASICADRQDQYFKEIDELEEAGVISDGDLGDGCVTHFYIHRPSKED